MVVKPLNGMEDMTVCLTMGQNVLVDVIADRDATDKRLYLCIVLPFKEIMRK